MRHKHGFIRQTRRLMFQIEKEARKDAVNTQASRKIWIHKLEVLFKEACSCASPNKDENKQVQNVTLKERQMWSHVAAHIGIVLGTLSKNYDETQLCEDLKRLRRLIDEIDKFNAQRIRAASQAQDAKLPENESIQSRTNF